MFYCRTVLLLNRVIVESGYRGGVESFYRGIVLSSNRFIVGSGECGTGRMLKRLFVVELFYRGIGGLSNRSTILRFNRSNNLTSTTIPRFTRSYDPTTLRFNRSNDLTSTTIQPTQRFNQSHDPTIQPIPHQPPSHLIPQMTVSLHLVFVIGVELVYQFI